MTRKCEKADIKKIYLIFSLETFSKFGIKFSYIMYKYEQLLRKIVMESILNWKKNIYVVIKMK